jgi:hypothetical protein
MYNTATILTVCHNRTILQCICFVYNTDVQYLLQYMNKHLKLKYCKSSYKIQYMKKCDKTLVKYYYHCCALYIYFSIITISMIYPCIVMYCHVLSTTERGRANHPPAPAGPSGAPCRLALRGTATGTCTCTTALFSS